MEQDQSNPVKRSATNVPSVLLAGFQSKEAENISLVLAQMGWEATSLSKEAEIESAFAAQRFDITVVDADHLEVFAPHFIARLRDSRGRSADATILAVGHSMLDGLKDQLMQSGANLVIPKPSDPRAYIVSFTRAATLRVQNIGAWRG
ncbi:MAG: hypothetical protein AAGA12_14640 [Pseudomonadota bacterium]